jgi:hypothetical protein
MAGAVSEETALVIAEWLEAEYTGPHMDASVRRAAKRIREGDWKKSLDE